MRIDDEDEFFGVLKNGKQVVVSHAPAGHTPEGAVAKVSNAFRNTVAAVVGGAGTLVTVIGGTSSVLLRSEAGAFASTMVAVSVPVTAAGAVASAVVMGSDPVAVMVGGGIAGLSGIAAGSFAAVKGSDTVKSIVSAATLVVGYAGLTLTDLAVDTVAAKDALGDRMRSWRDRTGLRSNMDTDELESAFDHAVESKPSI